MEKAVTVGAVTHTHTHTHRDFYKQIKNKGHPLIIQKLEIVEVDVLDDLQKSQITYQKG